MVVDTLVLPMVVQAHRPDVPDAPALEIAPKREGQQNFAVLLWRRGRRAALRLAETLQAL